MADDGIRVAWLEAAAARIPQETLLRIPPGGIPLDDLTDALKETGFEGAAQAASWVLAETGNFFLDACYDDGNYDGFCDPWEDEIIEEGAKEGARPPPLWTWWAGWPTGWRRTFPAASPGCWTSSWGGSPNKHRR